MPLPIDVTPAEDSASSFVDSISIADIFVEAQVAEETLIYQLLAERRMQLEDAETLRRMRAL